MKFTQSVLKAISDETKEIEMAEGHRSLARMAWHIVTTIPEMMAHGGLEFTGTGKDDPVPGDMKAICEAYDDCSGQLMAKVKQEWSDEKLITEHDFYGEKWPLGKALMTLILHEIHHRGQLMAVMRQAGLTVPSVYGPAKEGWAAYGAEPPKI
jgi:uncharacterized damage-inducible protein DinB